MVLSHKPILDHKDPSYFLYLLRNLNIEPLRWALTIHGINRIVLGHNFFLILFFFLKKDMTLSNRVILKNRGHISGRMAKFIPCMYTSLYHIIYKYIIHICSSQVPKMSILIFIILFQLQDLLIQITGNHTKTGFSSTTHSKDLKVMFVCLFQQCGMQLLYKMFQCVGCKYFSSFLDIDQNENNFTVINSQSNLNNEKLTLRYIFPRLFFVIIILGLT